MNLLYLTILFPFVGYLLLIFNNGRLSEKLSALIGVGSIGLSLITTIFIGLEFYKQGTHPFTQLLWNWIQIDEFNIQVSWLLDGLSFSMLSVVTGVGFLIHIFASWYMRGEEGYSRFFAYTNLFISSMIILILADNLMLMYLGWEVVGLCSYLLIGFYYKKPENINAAIKAFITTRIGDIFLVFSLFIFFDQLGTLNFSNITNMLPLYLTTDNHNIMLKWATFMLLCGAVGKSAQLPLQTWLVDAMAGPTPVSALIHSATMVTAGVYLITRTHEIFLFTPEVLNLVSIIGACTLIIAGFSAILQSDIKRILAYSTMGQIGYMFVALGVQAWNAAIFHLMIHAFFKALLFLSAGSLILSCHHEQNIFKMGGLRKDTPFIYYCFLVGGSALSALPLLTAGFYSKEAILLGIFKSGNLKLMTISILGSFLTCIYTFRMIFVIFHGKKKLFLHNIQKGITHNLPLIVLLILSTFMGSWITLPLSGLLTKNEFVENSKLMLEVTSGIISIIGIIISNMLWLHQCRSRMILGIMNSIIGRSFKNFWFSGWGFDWLYNKIFITSYLFIARVIRNDPVNFIMNLPLLILRLGNKYLTSSVNGYTRCYIASMSIGAVIILSLLILNKN